MNIKQIIKEAKYILVVMLFTTSPVQSNPLEIHGFLSQGYLQTDRGDYMIKAEDGTFKFNEMGINISSDISDDIRLGIQFISRAFGELSENASKVDWGYADYRWRNYLGFRFGRIKLPFGMYNEIRDIDMLRTSIFLPSSIYSESWRETTSSIDGLGIYGNISIDYMGDINYQALVGQLDISSSGGIAKYIERMGASETTNIEPKKTYNASITWDLPIDGLTIGSSFTSNKLIETAMIGDHFIYQPLRMATDTNAQLPGMINQVLQNKQVSIEDSSKITKNVIDFFVPQEYQSLDNKWPKEGTRNHNKLDYWILSLRYQWRDFTLSAEYLDARLNNEFFLGDISLSKKSNLWHSQGYYLSGAYALLDWLELGVYYSVFYDDTDNKHCEFYKEWNQLDSYKYSVAELYMSASQYIRQKFQYEVEKELGQSIDITEKDLETIELKPDYEVKRTKYNDYNGWFKELVLSMSAHINDQWTFKLEGHFIDGISLMDWTVNNGDIPRKRFLFASKVTFSF